jgi:hypothetical protein
VKKSDFAVIYTSKIPPKILPGEHATRGEATMRNLSIRVDPDNRYYSLDPRSRLNFGKVYTVDYSVKVKSIGMVNRGSMRDLVYQFRNVWKPAFTPPEPVEASQSMHDSTDITEPSAPFKKPSREQEQRDSSKESDRKPSNGVHRPSPESSHKAKPSLSNEASSAVDLLLSRGHSVDQILSAFDGKRFNQDRIFGMGSSDDIY